MKAKIMLFFFIFSITLISCTEKSANDLLLPWNEKEIINHRFELISDTKIETFVFHHADNGMQKVTCTYGKKDSFVTGPIEYWRIEDGLLCIYRDENMLSNERIGIGKIRIDEEKGILYAYRNNKKVEYKYIKKSFNTYLQR